MPVPRPKTPGAALRRLRTLKDRKTRIEALEKEVNKEISYLEETLLPEMLEEADLEKISEPGIGTAVLEATAYAYVPVARRGEFVQWMRENGNGSMVKEEVHHQTLKSWIVKCLAEGESYPEHLVNVTPKTVVKFRRR